MNSQVMAVTVIMVCLVCPICAGFLMPTGEVEAVGYTTESPINITDGLNNDRISVPVTYDSYLNNLFQYHSGNNDANYPSGDYTTVPNSFPKVQRWSVADQAVTFMTPGTKTINPPTVPGYAYVFYSTSDVDLYDSNGNWLSMAIAYGNTKLTYGFNAENQATSIENTLTAVSSVAGAYPVYAYLIGGGGEYLDTSKGLYSTSPNWYWSNTQVNSKVCFVLDSVDNTVLTARDNGNSSSLNIDIINDQIQVTFEDSSVADLGSVSVYTKVLVEFDCATSTTTVTGLYGMDSFTKNVADCKGSSVSGSMSLDSIITVAFTGAYGSGARYYVLPGAAFNDNTAVMNDVSMDPNAYYPSSLWSTTMKNAGIFGSSIDFNVTSNGVTTTYSYNVVSGKAVNVPIEGSTTDVDLMNVSIALVPLSDGSGNVLRINGKLLSIGTLDANDTVTITFDGIWKMNTTISKLTSYTYSYYDWQAGTFNIGSTTFCLIGLLAAVLMAIISGLCAFKYDTGGLLPLFVSGIAGAIYLLLLFSYA